MSKNLHRLALLLCVATLGLIFAGGMVTTTGSGLSVPDWPLSYGRLMPPMVGGIFYEHGHRMIATFVGLLTVIFAVLASFKEDRKWVRRAAWGAVGLVILQGTLGGLTVLLRLPPPISIAHACVAQSFFCLVVALAVWTSRFWRSDVAPRTEPSNIIPLHRMALALFAATFVQLILGATLRHTGYAFPFHITGAATVLGMGAWALTRVLRFHPSVRSLRNLSVLLLSATCVQIALGVATYLLLIHRFPVVPPPMWALLSITFHVVVGAFVLGLTVLFALISYRTRPASAAPLQTTLSDYVTLTKPGISFMCGVTAFAGYVLGSGGHVDYLRLFHTCLGTLMAAGGAGSLNMLIERDVDAQMKRTQARPLPAGRLQPAEVLCVGLLLGFSGIAYLSATVNALTAALAGLTISIYLYIYTPLKKISVACVTAGGVAGALPPVMGWTAATGHFGWAPAVLFGILFFWQFPHFLSLAWLYKDDYASGGLHMVGETDRVTGRSVFLTSLALLAVSVMPTVLGLTGRTYFVTALLLSGVFAAYSFRFAQRQERPEAKRVFLFSLLYIPALVAMMVLNSALVWSVS